MAPLATITILELPLIKLPVKLFDNVKFPKLAFRAVKLPEKLAVLPETLPVLLMMTVGVSPTEKPLTELNGCSAMLLSLLYYIYHLAQISYD
jgi:hypothetical protein